MALEKQESQIDDELRYLFPQTFNSLGSPPSNDANIINVDDEEVETLEPKKRRRILGSWWDDVEAFNELSCVVKGLRNDAESRVDSFFSSTDLHKTKTKKKKDEKRSSLSSHHEGFCNLYKQDPKSSVKEERPNSVSKSNTPTKAVKAEPASAPAPSASAATGPVTEDEIRAVLMEKNQFTTKDLVHRFMARLQTKEDKNAFADVLRKISKIQKNAGSLNFVLLREK